LHLTVSLAYSNAELRAGAACAIADVKSDEAVETLITAIESGKLKPESLDDAHRRRLLEHSNASIRDRAAKALGGAKP
jgi:HEAT repeat protein